MRIDFQTYRRSAAARARHCFELGAAGFSRDEVRSALRDSATLMRNSELSCSVEMTEAEEKRIDRRSELAEKRLAAIADRHAMILEWSGDPRGCPRLVSADKCRAIGLD